MALAGRRAAHPPAAIAPACAGTGGPVPPTGLRPCAAAGVVGTAAADGAAALAADCAGIGGAATTTGIRPCAAAARGAAAAAPVSPPNSRVADRITRS